MRFPIFTLLVVLYHGDIEEIILRARGCSEVTWPVHLKRHMGYSAGTPVLNLEEYAQRSGAHGVIWSVHLKCHLPYNPGTPLLNPKDTQRNYTEIYGLGNNLVGSPQTSHGIHHKDPVLNVEEYAQKSRDHKVTWPVHPKHHTGYSIRTRFLNLEEYTQI